MASRTAYVGTQSVGDVLTSANFSKLPGGWIGDTQITSSSQTGITAEVDVTGLSVTVTVNTNRRIKIWAYVPVNPSTSTTRGSIRIKESTTQLTRADFHANAAATMALAAMVTLTPTAGSHTYKVAVAAPSGTIDVSPSTTAPAIIYVSDEGPAT